MAMAGWQGSCEGCCYQGCAWCPWYIRFIWYSKSLYLITLDRRSVRWSPDLDPASFRHIAQQGDFELESLTLEDVLVTVYQPGGFRPYTFSIFRADIGTLRKQWLFYDFLKAEGIVGQFDNCLFSLHRPQSIGRTNEQDARDSGWSTMVSILPFYSHPPLIATNLVPVPDRRRQHRPSPSNDH